jgi:hypothetical protein
VSSTDQDHRNRLLARLVPDTNPGGAVYGMLTIGALLAAESGLRDTYIETLGSTLVILALYWLAHSYAELLGHRLTTGERLTTSGLWRALQRDWAIVRGGAVPLLALLVCWIAGVKQETAVTAALWSTAVSLLAFELLAGLRGERAHTRAARRERLLEACVGAALGLGVLALRVILH